MTFPANWVMMWAMARLVPAGTVEEGSTGGFDVAIRVHCQDVVEGELYVRGAGACGSAPGASRGSPQEVGRRADHGG